MLLQALEAQGVEFMVAPYEADAQMAFMAINGKVYAVITEDSDMLAYGCPRVSNSSLHAALLLDMGLNPIAPKQV